MENRNNLAAGVKILGILDGELAMRETRAAAGGEQEQFGCWVVVRVGPFPGYPWDELVQERLLAERETFHLSHWKMKEYLENRTSVTFSLLLECHCGDRELCKPLQ